MNPTHADVVLVVPPFFDIERPAMGPSLLVASLLRRGVSAVVVYPNVAWAERIGLPLYNWFAGCEFPTTLADLTATESLATEWAFADLAGLPHRDPEAYCARFFRTEPALGLVPQMLAVRALREAFLEDMAATIRALSPRIVGFTTTLASTTAALAIARKLKEQPGEADPPIVVFGGSACEAGMGTQMLRSFEIIDWVCLGEGDVAFPAFVDTILAGREPDVPGMQKRGEDTRPPSPAVELESLPYPHFADYFERIARSPFHAELHPRLSFETSRGCWWGQKHHCTFCGLNRATMAFRSKSGGRAFDELHALVAQWNIRDVDAVDSILDVEYLKTFFPRLAAEGSDIKLFYEIKSNLDWRELELLARAGVTAIQPGIESLDTGTLRLMRKGTTAAQNVCFLRWCAELGIGVGWNLLFGFPGEDPGALTRMAELLPLLHHLPRPSACTRIRLDRFSPLFVQRSGITQIRPKEAYQWIYALPDDDLSELAYFFDFAYGDGRDPDAYGAPLVHAAARWADPKREPAELVAVQAGDAVIVRDSREAASKQVHVLGGVEAQVFRACDRPRTIDGLTRALALPVPEVEAALRDLEQRRIVVLLDQHWIALSLWRGLRPTNQRTTVHLPNAN